MEVRCDEKGLVGLYNLETRLVNRIVEQLKDTLPSLRKEVLPC